MPGCHNDEVIARVLQEDANSNYARDLQSDENSNYARILHLKELQEQSNSNSARELQQRYINEQIDSNHNMAIRLQEQYYRELDRDIPVIHKTEKLEKNKLEKNKLEKVKVIIPEVSFLKLFYELLPFLLFILLIVYLSTFMFSSTKIKGSKSRKK